MKPQGKGPWALAAQEARCSDLTLTVQMALAGEGLGLPQFPLLKDSVSVENLTGSI